MTLPFDIATAQISVIGAARSGRAAVRLLRQKGAAVLLSDAGPAEKQAEVLEEMARLGAAVEFGGHSERVFDANLIVVSPGVPSDSPVLVEAATRGIPVISEIELGSIFCKAPIAGITGTNGKTTTTTLAGEIFRAAGLRTMVAGNIGHAFCDAVLETGGDADVAVLEVSSFQLDHCVSFRPEVAVLTTITPDHLNRYGGRFEDYVASKQRIFRMQYAEDALIFNADNEETVDAIAPAIARRFGTSVQRVLERGGWMEARTLYLNVGDGPERIASIDELHLRGRHNYMNILMAALTARLRGVPIATISDAVRAFEGVEHRLEFVRRLDDVTYINDSKATNVDSVVIALQSFHQQIVLIAGGRDKDSPYDPLFPLLADKVRAAVLIGEATERMAEAFQGYTEVHRASSMPDAVTEARRIAKPGEIVLLSPACASFDMFDNFEHRGLVFKRLVQMLGAAEQTA